MVTDRCRSVSTCMGDRWIDLTIGGIGMRFQESRLKITTWMHSFVCCWFECLLCWSVQNQVFYETGIFANFCFEGILRFQKGQTPGSPGHTHTVISSHAEIISLNTAWLTSSLKAIRPRTVIASRDTFCHYTVWHSRLTFSTLFNI